MLILGRSAMLAASLCSIGCSSGAWRAVHAVGAAASYGSTHPTAGPLVSYEIPGISMMPLLKPGDVVMIDTGAYRRTAPRVGDVVTFMPPVTSTTPFIKRIVAAGGDTFALEGGRLLINGSVLRENYLKEPTAYQLKVADRGLYVKEPYDTTWLSVTGAQSPPKSAWWAANRIPAGYYILLGDNRNDSEDSHVFGLVNRHSITGRMVFAI